MHLIQHLLLAGAGGFFGAVLRCGVWLACISCFSKGQFYATLLVNAAGSFLLGFILPLWTDSRHPLRMFLVLGVLGGFTTFSSFSADGLQLFQQHHFGWFGLYIVGNVLLCLLAVWGGFELQRILLK